jgi:hypothetical protein
MSATAASEIYGAFSNDAAWNVSFSTIAGNKVVASANVTAAPSPVNVTGANGSSVNAQTIAFSNANGMSLGVSTAANGATVTGSYTVPTQTAFVLSNSNGVSFGTNGSTVTATVATNYMASNQSSNFAATGFTTTTVAGSVVAGTLDTAGLKLAVPAFLTTTPTQTAFVFSNSNGVSFGTNGSTVTATVATNYQSQGAYLTTARASNDGLGLATAQTNVTWTANSAGLSINAAGYAGTGFSGTNASATLNSNGLQLSVAAPGGGGGGFTGGVSTGGNTLGNTGTQTGQVVFVGGNNVTLSVATAAGGAQTITISGANAGGAQTGISGIIAGTQTQTVGTLSFADGNGISFGLSNSSILTASYTVPTVPTSYVSQVNGSSGAVSFGVGSSLSSSVNGSSVTWGLASNITTALQSAGAYLTTAAQSSASNVSQVIAATNNTGGGTATLTGGVSFSNANGLTFYTSAGNAVVGSYTVPTQSQQPMAASGSNGSFTANTLSFSNANGVSFGTSAGSAITASYTVPTVTQYFSATNTTFNGANISGSMTLNTNGMQLSMSVAAGGGAAVTASASNGSFTVGTLAFSNANNVTFGTSAGSIITASVAAPGAAAENNWVNLLGANTAGNTTASGSTIGYSGINLTLSGTNGSVVNISAPATSSLVGASGITISSAGSTVSIGQILGSYFDNFNGFWPNSTTMTARQSTSAVVPLYIAEPLSFGFIRMPITASNPASTTAATTGNTQFSYGQTRTHNFVLYSRGSGASSLSLQSVASTSLTDQQSINVSAAANSTQFSYTNRATYQSEGGTFSTNMDYSSSAASLNFHTSNMTGYSGVKMVAFPWATSLSAGQYWLAYGASTSSASQFTANGSVYMLGWSNYGASQPNLAFGTLGSATNSSVAAFYGLGSFTAAAQTTAIIAISAISSTSAHNKMMIQIGNIA